MADLSALSDDQLIGSIKPTSYTPSSFAAQYGGVADAVGQKLGVDRNVLLAQWGHETGWGKSVIPGTNNLGNIKDFSGAGVAARDNMTGSTDAYRAYASPSDFASDYASLISRKYPGAVGAGADMSRFASALKAAGYAEDPQYVAKLQGAMQTVQRAQSPQTAAPAAAQPGMLARVGNAVATAISGTANAATPQELAGISDDDLLAALAARRKGPAAVPQSSSWTIDNLGRQAGLAARAVGHGVADAVGLVANPVNATINAIGGAFGHDPQLQDVDTLIKRGVDAITPAPANSTEQMAGEIGGAIANPVNLIGGPIVGGARSLAGMVGRGAVAGAVTGAAQPMHQGDTVGTMAERAGVGALGGAIGGAAGSTLGAIADRLATGVSRVMSSVGARLPSTQAAASQNADAMIRQAAQEQGIDLSVIPDSILNNVRARVTDALATNRTLDPAAALRQAEGAAVLGPENGLTLGQVTRDPRQFTTERNLRGIQGAGEPLMQRYADQNNALIGSLNRQGANEALGEYQTGRQLMDALGRQDAASQAHVAGMYAQAHAINGNDIPLDATQFVTTAREQLQQQMRDLHLPGAIDRQLERFASGDTPLNVSTAEQFKTILSQGIADNDGKNGNIVRALGIVRDALDNTEPLLGGEAAQGAAAIAAFNRARDAAAARFGTIESTPALRAIVSGRAVPDNFFSRYVLNGTADDVNALMGMVPDQGRALQMQALEYLKGKALGGASDEVGTFSQAAFNKALNSIGNVKLNALFGPQQAAQLRQIGRVAANVQAEPAGAAVNHSNTAAAGASMALNALTSLADKMKLPGLNIARNSINQFVNERAAQTALGGELPMAVQRRSLDSLNQLLPFVPGVAGAAAVPASR
ncbi:MULTISPECIES: glucosaminidase domain-containing protein [Burkholderia]|uniref:Mannosyl-glycoprotein endo-beta-N-acetylglucosamidase-like domain-containing protein n=1 Tax=Burkholderia contaminans TaxID=488447 RepID=A0A2S5DRM5_9BURK|nr:MULTISPECIES: glucosaminidase domain-containing protein [Burkholderia]EKS9798229.1 glucosaminidase domain-containing protein [Burkholderia cepacia]EKS9808376.1 glucosaminidase domain-containing protein [Burkholderia cepacia]EKS9815986.1 glucosaminidase domain-containing protein [Burkholderia cepacia]EKS9823580.1 glucosaminidase domain-containing protein [Burkholderia cepacia]EKS9827308.1 glucosaminidase domain-containing protein [Burkholderia cepacia]